MQTAQIAQLVRIVHDLELENLHLPESAGANGIVRVLTPYGRQANP
ncbi:hypothetical protein [Streptomyces sp. NPDC056670]